LPLGQLAAFLCFFLVGLSSAALAADDLYIHFKTTPRVALLRPFADPIDLSLLVTGADGKPVRSGSVAIRLDAPAPARFFSTDFPRVEGTILNEMRLPLRQGRAGWKFLFPIRGEYRLSVDAVADNGAKTSQIFVIHVRENRQKLWALGGFSAALLVLGFAAGRVFTRAGTGTPLLLAAALLVAVPAGSHEPIQSGPSTRGLEIEPATVGKASLVRWRPLESRPPGATVRLTLSIFHLEKGKTVFAIERIAVGEEWSMKFHFPDGAGYRVTTIAEEQGRPPVRSEQAIAVKGVEPPMKAMVPALSYFLGLIAVGLAVGRWTKRRAAAR
jgi:hypothetical protein